MVNRFFNDLVFGLFIHYWYRLLDFYYFAEFLVDIFGNLSLNLNLFCLDLGGVVGDSHLFLDCLGHQDLLFGIYWCLLDHLDQFLLLNGDFYNADFFIIFNNLLDDFCLNWIWCLNSHWNLYRSCNSILVRNLFSIWNSLLKIDCKMRGISNYYSSLMF
jgi:hypothetical protein